MIYPVILSGGAGTRLWPMSRLLYPKQLLPLLGPETMIQETVRRVSDAERFEPPMIVCNDVHRFIIAEQLRAVDVNPAAIVLEPVGRNTAPAAAIAAIMCCQRQPEALMLVLPSDHLIRDVAAFQQAIDHAAAAAAEGALVTFGITPGGPETGYGYIHRGAALDGHAGAFAVESFVEKPDAATARNYLEAGTYLWNSGLFLFRADRYLAELGRLEPDMVSACERAVAGGRQDLDFRRLDDDAFAAAPDKSIDYAVMEHTKDAAVVPVDMGWSDVGAWSALWSVTEKDENGNVLAGDVLTEDLENCYVRSDSKLVAALGLRDMVLVVTEDVVFAAPRERAPDVRGLVERLKDHERSEHESHLTVYRPWGHYKSIDTGARFQVKRITVKPGGVLSLQKHHHRAEHWVVVKGTAQVTRGEDVLTLHENESTFIPLGVVHRLENVGEEPLDLIEVQSGGYLGEDDIVRLEDVYGRG